MMEYFCPRCNVALNDWFVCPNCGTQYAMPRQQETPQTQYQQPQQQPTQQWQTSVTQYQPPQQQYQQSQYQQQSQQQYQQPPQQFQQVPQQQSTQQWQTSVTQYYSPQQQYQQQTQQQSQQQPEQSQEAQQPNQQRQTTESQHQQPADESDQSQKQVNTEPPEQPKNKMSKGKIAAIVSGVLVVLIVLIIIVVTMGGSDGSGKSSSSSSDFETNTEANNKLDGTSYHFQGVTIPGNTSWTVSQSEEYSYYISIDNGHSSHISIFSALYGQTDTLTNAWHEFTTAGSDPIKDESWDDNGIAFSSGNWTNNAGITFYLISGYDASSGKGFLVNFSLSPEVWSENEAKSLYTAIKESITYNPTETTLDYKEAFNKRKQEKSDYSTNQTENSQSSSSSSTQSYSAGSYRVGTDIPAGEYKLTCSGNHGYFCAYPNTSKSDILENGNFTTCTYIAVSDGQLLEVKGATFVAIADAQPTTTLSGQGVYKVGLDIAAGEYNITATSDQGYYAILSTVDANTGHNIVDNDNFEGNSFVSVSAGQYLEISRASINQ